MHIWIQGIAGLKEKKKMKMKNKKTKERTMHTSVEERLDSSEMRCSSRRSMRSFCRMMMSFDSNQGEGRNKRELID